MSGSGLFIARSFIPHAVKPCFDQFLVHPVAKLYKDAVLKNNAFSLKHQNNSICSLGSIKYNVTFMWWAKIFVEDNIKRSFGTDWGSHYYPLDFEIRGNDVYKDDILLYGNLIDHTEDYISDGTDNADMYVDLDTRKKECNNALIGCMCGGHKRAHISSWRDCNYWYTLLSKLLYTINRIINDDGVIMYDYMRAIWHEYHSNFPYKTALSSKAAIKGTWSYVDEIYHIRKKIINIINDVNDDGDAPTLSAKYLEDKYIKYSNDTRHFINRYDKIIYHL